MSTTNVFTAERIELAGEEEWVVRGGRSLLPKLSEAFAGIRRVGVIGWGPQGSAQACNLRESLAFTDIAVTVGLREGSRSRAEAEAAGFSVADGTLGEMFDVIRSSELVLLLIADAAQAQLYKEVFAALRPGAALGLSHGFLVAYLDAVGDAFPPDIDVVGVCPKGMGASVRRLYEQGRAVGGAGINASFAVEQDASGRATDIALGWAVGIGAPYAFRTTLRDEFRSDIVGERSVLLGVVHATVEALYRRFVELGDTPEIAFVRACESLTGPIARTISHGGMRAVHDALEGDARRSFEEAYAATHPVALALTEELYDEVDSGNELRSVLLACERLDRFPMADIEGTRMWRVGQDVRARRDELGSVGIEPLTAGVFCGAMIALVDVLRSRGHAYSEVVNESIIEIVDSLIPYMHARGVAYMVDNCSTTARVGARKWAPRFEAQLTQVVLPSLDDKAEPRSDELIDAFRTHPVHDAFDVLADCRPPVDIAVD